MNPLNSTSPSQLKLKNMSDPTLEQISAKLKQFNADRDWDQYHSPRNLAMALSVEAAELLECFLWVKDGEQIPDSKKAHVEEEAADVFICLMNFCAQANIDLTSAFQNKLAKNEQKYPVDKARGSRAKYDEL